MAIAPQPQKESKRRKAWEIVYRALVGLMFFFAYLVLMLMTSVVIAWSPLQIAGVDLFGTILSWIGIGATFAVNGIANAYWQPNRRTLRDFGKLALLALGPAMVLYSTYLEHSVRWAHLIIEETPFPPGFDQSYLQLAELLVWAATR